MKAIKNLSKKQKISILVAIVALVLIAIVCVVFFKKEPVQKLNLAKKQELETELITMHIEIKQENTDSKDCLITFTSNDENKKIKTIEYPEEQGKEAMVIKAGDAGKQEVGLDYNFKNDDLRKIFKVTTTTEDVVEKETAYSISYDANEGTGEPDKIENLIDDPIIIEKKAPDREGYIFYGWNEEKDANSASYITEDTYNKNKDTTLYAVWKKDNVKNKSLLGYAETITEEGNPTIKINNEVYETDFIINDGDLVLDGTTNAHGATLSDSIYMFGDASKDVQRTENKAKHMVILKVKGNLTINENVTLTTCKSADGYGGPKGFLIYCTGDLINNGTIDMTARGAYAEGQEVYLWENEDNSGNYESVPATGADGGAGVSSSDRGTKGTNGADGLEGRKTGGGGSGGAIRRRMPFKKRRKWIFIFRRNWKWR